jgi:hypothetical protein
MTDAEITALAERLETAERVLCHSGFGLDSPTRLAVCEAATALRALLSEREAIKPFIDLAVATTVEGSPDYREWVGQANDWTIVLAFAGRSITLGQLRALSALAPKEPMRMLVDQEWLQRKVETDPDVDVEAGSPPKEPEHG